MRIEGDFAFVPMLGACGGCAASTMTLNGAIEAVVREEVPAIREVLQV